MMKELERLSYEQLWRSVWGLQSEFKHSGSPSGNFRNMKLDQKSLGQDRCIALTSGQLL